MSNFFDFLDLITNEVGSLLDIVPDYIKVIFTAAASFSLVLAIKRAVLS